MAEKAVEAVAMRKRSRFNYTLNDFCLRLLTDNSFSIMKCFTNSFSSFFNQYSILKRFQSSLSVRAQKSLKNRLKKRETGEMVNTGLKQGATSQKAGALE